MQTYSLSEIRNGTGWAKDQRFVAAPAYTRDQVSQAVNHGIDLITNDARTYISDRDIDLLNLAVNAALHKLDNPAATLDDVILSCYQSDDLDTDYLPVVSAFGRVGYAEVPAVPEDQIPARAVETVLGWIS